MSQTRVHVEWLLNKIKNCFKFALLKSKMKIGLSVAGKICCAYTLLQNARTYLYGNHISEFFQPCPLLLGEYFRRTFCLYN